MSPFGVDHGLGADGWQSSIEDNGAPTYPDPVAHLTAEFRAAIIRIPSTGMAGRMHPKDADMLVAAAVRILTETTLPPDPAA